MTSLRNLTVISSCPGMTGKMVLPKEDSCAMKWHP